MNEIERIERDKKLTNKIEETRNSLSVDRLDMSYGEILNMYENNEIIISPEYQRLFRWDISQRSRFIESILLGFPIPPIFVAEDSKGRWELVDGLQRISTIISFFGKIKDIKGWRNEKAYKKNDWILEKGEKIEELEGYSSKTLPLKYLLNIKRAYCRIEIVKWNSKFDMRYELFNRLNTGGTILEPQEIRNCIFREKDNNFIKFLEKVESNPDFTNLVNISEFKKEQLYLQELGLRFITIFNNFEKVDRNFSLYMTHYMKDIIDSNSFSLEQEKIFFETINILKELDYKIFRFENNQFSTSLYDSIMVGIAKNKNKYLNLSKEQILLKIEKLKENEDFRKYVGSASSSKDRIKKRTEIAIEYFGEF